MTVKNNPHLVQHFVIASAQTLNQPVDASIGAESLKYLCDENMIPKFTLTWYGEKRNIVPL